MWHIEAWKNDGNFEASIFKYIFLKEKMYFDSNFTELCFYSLVDNDFLQVKAIQLTDIYIHHPEPILSTVKTPSKLGLEEYWHPAETNAYA